MKAEYRITIRQRPEADPKPRKPGKVETAKAVLLALLALSVVFGVFLAAAILGSIIATVLLVLMGVSIVAWLIRRLLRIFKTSRPAS